MVYLLDTNIVSLLDSRRHDQSPEMISWIKQNGSSLFLSVITIAEMEAGVLKLRRERKAARAGEIEKLIASILTDFGDRVLDVDIETARLVAQLGEKTHRQPVALADLIIGATALRHGLVVLTRNMREFGRLGIRAQDPVAG